MAYCSAITLSFLDIMLSNHLQASSPRYVLKAARQPGEEEGGGGGEGSAFHFLQPGRDEVEYLPVTRYYCEDVLLVYKEPYPWSIAAQVFAYTIKDIMGL